MEADPSQFGAAKEKEFAKVMAVDPKEQVAEVRDEDQWELRLGGRADMEAMAAKWAAKERAGAPPESKKVGEVNELRRVLNLTMYARLLVSLHDVNAPRTALLCLFRKDFRVLEDKFMRLGYTLTHAFEHPSLAVQTLFFRPPQEGQHGEGDCEVSGPGREDVCACNHEELACVCVYAYAHLCVRVEVSLLDNSQFLPPQHGAKEQRFGVRIPTRRNATTTTITTTAPFTRHHHHLYQHEHATTTTTTITITITHLSSQRWAQYRGGHINPELLARERQKRLAGDLRNIL
jgi:hypothetical protein